MRTLHIVNWFPNALNPHEAPFIARHVRAMKAFGPQEVWHIEVRQDKHWGFLSKGTLADRTLILRCPLRTWYVIEWITTLLVLWAWVTRSRKQRYHVVNFYIAYPLCSRLGVLKTFIRRPMLMMEQWSAYHFNFGSTSGGLDRIRRIFRHRVPVCCVSSSLADDIRRFSGVPDLACPVVPNVVLVEHFRPDAGAERSSPPTFFAMAGWRRPKRPEVMVEALALLLQRGRAVRLRIAGDGPEMEQVKTVIQRCSIGEHVDLLGRLEPPAAAMEMCSASALMHCSDYETFSVVCAEALCCGTPVIASRVGGIPSFVNERNGLLIATNEAAAWADAIEAHWDRIAGMDRARMAAEARARFSPDSVGRRLTELFERRMKGLPVDNG